MKINFSYHHPAVFDTLAAFKGQKMRVGSSSDFSDMTDHERRKAIEQIDNQIQALRPRMVAALKTDWSEAQQEYANLRRAKTGAADRASKLWDMPRLDYSRRSVEGFVNSASLADILAMKNKIELDGDLHELRAFLEAAGDALRVRTFPGEEPVKVVGTRKEFEKSWAEIVKTPEQKNLAMAGADLTKKIGKLYEATNQAGREFPTHITREQFDNAVQTGAELPRDEFAPLLEGVHVSQVTDHRLDTVTTVDLTGPRWGEAAKPAKQNMWGELADKYSIGKEAQP